MLTAAAIAAHLPPGVRIRRFPGVAGLDFHALEAGSPSDPLLLLLHGFPELSFSWRKVIAPLAAAGYHVVAPDQRGYGLTTGWTRGYDVDLEEFGMPRLAGDAAALVAAAGHDRAAAVIGHDFGSPVAAWAALSRPEVFPAAALMSAPFGGPPDGWTGAPADMAAALAALDPPRKHYQLHYCTPGAEAEMMGAPAGFAAFLRAYYHCKSADWPGNAPHRLPDWSAAALAVMPRYYIMNLAEGMAETALSMAPPAGADCPWLTEAELAVYVAAFETAGLQGGLNWYRWTNGPDHGAALAQYRNRRIDGPVCFVAGAQDWGVWQAPGALEAMAGSATADYRGATLIEGAGHWVQQERPEATVNALLSFLREL